MEKDSDLQHATHTTAMAISSLDHGLAVDESNNKDSANKEPKSLTQAIHALPLELFDEIRDLVFTAPDGVHDIRGQLEPSATTSSAASQGDITARMKAIKAHREALNCLQVSRTTRTHFAREYYGCGARFIIHSQVSATEKDIRVLGDDVILSREHQVTPGFDTLCTWYESLSTEHRALIGRGHVLLLLPRVWSKTQASTSFYWFSRISRDVADSQRECVRGAFSKLSMRLQDDELPAVWLD